MPPDVPTELAYLVPAFDALARFAPEDLGDDNPEAIGIVEAALRQRLRGMTAREAEQAVNSDTELLQQWTSVPEAPPTAGYVFGALLGLRTWADFDELTAC
jgi:hypothetical protein